MSVIFFGLWVLWKLRLTTIEELHTLETPRSGLQIGSTL